VVVRVRVGLEEIVEERCAPVGVVQVQLDQGVARVLPDVLPEMEDVPAPPLGELQVRQPVRPRGFLPRGEALVLHGNAPVVKLRFLQLLR